MSSPTCTTFDAQIQILVRHNGTWGDQQHHGALGRGQLDRQRVCVCCSDDSFRIDRIDIDRRDGYRTIGISPTPRRLQRLLALSESNVDPWVRKGCPADCGARTYREFIDASGPAETPSVVAVAILTCPTKNPGVGPKLHGAREVAGVLVPTTGALGCALGKLVFCCPLPPPDASCQLSTAASRTVVKPAMIRKRGCCRRASAKSTS